MYSLMFRCVPFNVDPSDLKNSWKKFFSEKVFIPCSHPYSASCISFLHSLLSKQPEKRPTARQALRDIWLSKE